jgi:hypothetical protein
MPFGTPKAMSCRNLALNKRGNAIGWRRRIAQGKSPNQAEVL